MKPGNNILLIFFISLISFNFSLAEQKITVSPLINIDDIKPSFEELEENDSFIPNQTLKEKKMLRS